MMSDPLPSSLSSKSPRAQVSRKIFEISEIPPKPANSEPETLIDWFIQLPDWLRGWVRTRKPQSRARSPIPRSDSDHGPDLDSSPLSASSVLSQSADPSLSRSQDPDSGRIRGDEVAKILALTGRDRADADDADAEPNAEIESGSEPKAGAGAPLRTIPAGEDPFAKLRKWLIVRITKVCNAQTAESVASSAIASFFEKYVSEAGAGWIDNRKQAAWVLWRIARNKAIDRKRRRPVMLSLNDSQCPIDPQAPTLTPLEECLVEEIQTSIAGSQSLVAALGQRLDDLERRARELCGDDDDEGLNRLKAFWMLFFRRQLRLSDKDMQESLEWDEDTFHAFKTETFQPLNREFRKLIRQELEDVRGQASDRD